MMRQDNQWKRRWNGSSNFTHARYFIETNIKFINTLTTVEILKIEGNLNQQKPYEEPQTLKENKKIMKALANTRCLTMKSFIIFIKIKSKIILNNEAGHMHMTAIVLIKIWR